MFGTAVKTLDSGSDSGYLFTEFQLSGAQYAGCLQIMKAQSLVAQTAASSPNITFSADMKAWSASAAASSTRWPNRSTRESLPTGSFDFTLDASAPKERVPLSCCIQGTVERSDSYPVSCLARPTALGSRAISAKTMASGYCLPSLASRPIWVR